LTIAEQRRVHGREQYNPPSKFIQEIPTELLEEIRPRLNVARPVFQPIKSKPVFEEESGTVLEVGQNVMHATFGTGVVLDYEGYGSNAKVMVNFEEAGTKWMILTKSNLQPC